MFPYAKVQVPYARLMAKHNDKEQRSRFRGRLGIGVRLKRIAEIALPSYGPSFPEGTRDNAEPLRGLQRVQQRLILLRRTNTDPQELRDSRLLEMPHDHTLLPQA